MTWPSSFILYLLHPYSRTDVMAGFHLPIDPYFPNKGNGGWAEEEPEEIIEDDPEEEEEDEEGMEDDSDEEPEVYDPLPTHAPGRNFQGPTPQWAVNLRLWSR